MSDHVQKKILLITAWTLAIAALVLAHITK
jgi:hypothetical protein